MANELKLEIYKLKLLNKEDGTSTSFQKLFGKKLKYGKKADEIITQEHIFNTYYADFINKIDFGGYKLNEKKKKGFTISFEETGTGRKSHISSSSKDRIISGILDGGKHGRNRSLFYVDDKTQKTAIGIKHIVTDKFYFLIYTPLEHNEAILMIQGYSEIRISDVFRDHLLNYFKHSPEIVSKVEIFVPKSLKEKYLKGAVFKSIKFTSGWTVKPEPNGEIKQTDHEIEIKIEIIDKNQKKISYTAFKDFINVFGKSKFKPEGGDERKLIEFEKKNAKMISDKQEKAIDFLDEDNVIPVILLENEGIEVDEGGIPNFDQINNYCRELLNEVSKEVMPKHAIEDL